MRAPAFLLRATSVSFIVGLVSLGAACRSTSAAPAAEPFSVALPVLTTTSYDREYVGDVHATQRAELRARVRGVVESIAVDEGQAVKKGQLLLTLGTRELWHELNQARAATKSAAAELAAAQTEFKNAKLLFDKEIVSTAELAQLEAKVQMLASKLEEARAFEGRAETSLAYASVRAPFDGVVNRFPFRVGSLVDEGDLLTTLTNAEEVFVYFRVSEQEYLDFVSRDAAQPTTVALRLANGARYDQTGVIDATESELDRASGTIAFRARFPNPARLLKHGSSGKVVVTTELKDAIVIPQRSTFEIQDQVYVYAVDANDTVRVQRVIPKLRLRDAFVIDAGLDAHDRFVVEGLQKVKDGEKIAARLVDTTQRTSL